MASKKNRSGDQRKNLDRDQRKGDDTNPDPLTGEEGSHPVETGLGAAAGGAAAGAIGGAVAGPAGAAVGAVAGGIAGGLAGKAIGEELDPTVEYEYWRKEYPNRPYYSEEMDFAAFAPAYRYGWESRVRYSEQEWDDIQSDLEREWVDFADEASLDWEEAEPAIRDAWDRVEQQALATDRGGQKRRAK